MTSIKSKILVIIAFVMFAACNKESYLDVVPRGVVVPSTIEDFRSLLDQVETDPLDPSPLGQGFLKTHFIPFYISDDISVTEGLVVGFGLGRQALAAYRFEDRLYFPSEEDLEWKTYYNQIYVANIIIDGLGKLTDAPVSEKNALIAEARLHRAFAYFNLVNLYCVHYNPSSADTDLGVPIRDGIDLDNVDLTRASVQDVYDYIIEDITSSYGALPDLSAQGVRFRPSKAGAAGLLAKVYLYQQRYSEALTEVNKALGFYNTIRDLNRPEQFEIVGFGSMPLAQNNNEVIWFKGVLEQNRVSVVNTIVFFDNLYSQDDIRSNGATPASDQITSNDIPEKNQYSFWGRTFNRMIPTGINTPDLFLIRAECEARVGSIANANTALNTLREHRFDTADYMDINITDADELLTFVKEERRRELLGNPERMFDLKRYNRFDNDNISLVHEYKGVSYTLPANSRNWALPIAEKYILLNPEIEQNPRD